MHFTGRRVSNGNVFPISSPQPPRSIPSTSDSDSESHSGSNLPGHPRQPALGRLHKFRSILIPITLMLIFTTLILGAIYAYCVAKPHTAIANQLAQDATAEIDGSIFSRRDDSELIPATKEPQSVKDRDSEPQTALLFYTLATPGLSLVHLTFELVMHHHTPQYLTRRSGYVVLLAATALLTAGWLTTLGFWMHCELPPLNNSGQGLCPVQVRGHFMYGIHEVSIAKTVVGWLVSFVYVGHVVMLAMGWMAMTRVWRLQGSGGVEHGEAQEIVVTVEEQLRKETYLASGGR